ncbi:Vta1 like-domain-containing protein [Gaertneriomyces semiglobifer]|nr:Vta1 like-domain-containing protein [Gaertneriomyces semiglobifer]
MSVPTPPPAELKFINPYLQRARELQSKEPIVAYWCKFYAAKLAIDKSVKEKECQIFLLNLMDEMEQDKKALGANEAITNDVVAYAHVENFALRIFQNADTEDRQGRASKKTAKTFLAASIFLELLKVFGDIDSEVHDKIGYSKFKAADIIKALREGRTPTPGLPGEAPLPDDETQHTGEGFSQPTEGTSAAVPPPYPSQWSSAGQSSPPGSFSESGPHEHMPSASVHQPRPPPTTTASHAAPMSLSTPSDPTPMLSREEYASKYKAVQAAQKHSRFAISALQYDDIPTAIDNLEQALTALRQLKR